MRTRRKDKLVVKRGTRKNETARSPKIPEEAMMLMQIAAEQMVDDLLCVAVKPGARIRLGLFKYERDLILNEGSISLGLTQGQLAELKSAKWPELRMSLADWELFHGYVAAEANHCEDRRKRERLQKLADNIYKILSRHRESSTRKPGSHWFKSPLFPDEGGEHSAPDGGSRTS